ncbi:unnamed protein product, partial [Polarella glacialis]
MADKRPQDNDKDGGGRKAKKHKLSRTEKVDNYEEGERGFLVTGLRCQDALRGAKDLRLWLEVEAEPQDTSAEQASGSGHAASLEAELAELKGGPSFRP